MGFRRPPFPSGHSRGGRSESVAKTAPAGASIFLRLLSRRRKVLLSPALGSAVLPPAGPDVQLHPCPRLPCPPPRHSYLALARALGHFLFRKAGAFWTTTHKTGIERKLVFILEFARSAPPSQRPPSPAPHPPSRHRCGGGLKEEVLLFPGLPPAHRQGTRRLKAHGQGFGKAHPTLPAGGSRLPTALLRNERPPQ